MKRLVSLFMIMLGLCLVSCSSDSDDAGSRYYVKYSVSVRTYPVRIQNTTIKCETPEGEKTIKTVDAWEATYGPVSKSFKPKLNCSAKYGTLTGRIYISRDKEPFVIKAENSKESNLTLSCNIDF
jgi:hypothetical protein